MSCNYFIAIHHNAVGVVVVEVVIIMIMVIGVIVVAIITVIIVLFTFSAYAKRVFLVLHYNYFLELQF